MTDNRTLPSPRWVAPFTKSFWSDIVDMTCDPVATLPRLQAHRSTAELLMIPVLAFGGLQSQALSEVSVHQRWVGYLIGFPLGVLFGLVIVTTASYSLAIAMRILGLKTATASSLRLVSACYSGAVIYALAGLVAGVLFKINTSASFGMVGVTWAFATIIRGLRERKVPRHWALVAGLLVGMTILGAWLGFSAYAGAFAAPMLRE